MDEAQDAYQERQRAPEEQSVELTTARERTVASLIAQASGVRLAVASARAHAPDRWALIEELEQLAEKLEAAAQR